MSETEYLSARPEWRPALALLSLAGLMALVALAGAGCLPARLAGIPTSIPYGWRGDGTGEFANALPSLQPQKPSCIAWTAQLPGDSNSSPVLSQDRVFLTAEPTHLLSLDRATGRILWDREVSYIDTLPPAEQAAARQSAQQAKVALTELGAALSELGVAQRESRRKNAQGAGERLQLLRNRIDVLHGRVDAAARLLPPEENKEIGQSAPTPVTDGKSVWAVFGNSVVASFTFDGTLRWAHYVEVGADAGNMIGYERGVTASPLLVGRKLIVGRGRLRALDADTGAELWRSVPYHSFGTPALAQVGATKVLFTPEGQAVRVDDGRVLADKLSELFFIGPIVGGGLVIFAGTYDDTANYKARARAYELPSAAGDTLELKMRWERPLKGTRFYAMPLILNGHLIAIGAEGRLSVIDLATGNLLQERALDESSGTFMPSLSHAGRYIFARATDRVVVLEDRAPYRTLFAWWEPETKSSPAFDGNEVFFRVGNQLRCSRGSAGNR